MTFVREEILWEKINEGDEKELSVGPITRTDLVKYAGASGDFNPNHHDEIYSIRSGFDKPFAHGMLQGGILSRLITDWFGHSEDIIQSVFDQNFSTLDIF